MNDLIMLHCAANLQQHRKQIVSIRDTKKKKNAAKQRIRSQLKEKTSIIPKSPRTRKIWPLSGKKYRTRKSGHSKIGSKRSSEHLKKSRRVNSCEDVRKRY